VFPARSSSEELQEARANFDDIASADRENHVARTGEVAGLAGGVVEVCGIARGDPFDGFGEVAG
jgi:hypothetical protein